MLMRLGEFDELTLNDPRAIFEVFKILKEFSICNLKLLIFILKSFATSRALSWVFFTLDNSRAKVSSRDSWCLALLQGLTEDLWQDFEDS